MSDSCAYFCEGIYIPGTEIQFFPPKDGFVIFLHNLEQLLYSHEDVKKKKERLERGTRGERKIRDNLFLKVGVFRPV